MQKIGLFGGSFNPLHNGHVIMADSFVKSLGLEQCIFIPAAQSPFKKKEDYEFLTDQQRLAMLEDICQNNSKFDFWSYEIEKGDISYTYLTIKHARTIYPTAKLFWLIGKDHIYSFTKWKNWEEILSEVTLAIVNRGSSLDDESLDVLNSTIGKSNYEIIDAPLIDISSSYIRENIENRELISKLMPSVKGVFV
jgi:nicotinate-nucleotide adenylyltransferase